MFYILSIIWVLYQLRIQTRHIQCYLLETTQLTRECRNQQFAYDNHRVSHAGCSTVEMTETKTTLCIMHFTACYVFDSQSTTRYMTPATIITLG